MDKRVLYYCLGFIAVFTFLIFFDKLVTSEYQTDAKNTNVQNEISKTSVTVTPTTAPKIVINDDRVHSKNESERASAYLNYFMQLINKKDYQKAYELLKDDYKKERFYDLPTFKKYMQNTFKRQYNIGIKTVENRDNLLIADVNLIAKQYTQEEIIEGVRYKTDIFTVEEKPNGDFAVAFESFIAASQINSDNQINDKIKVRLVKQVRYSNSVKYTLIVQNESDKPLNLIKNVATPNIYLADVFGKKIEIERLQLDASKMKINAKEPTIVEVVFTDHYTSKFMPFRIVFENASYDSKNFIEVSAYIK